jgi:hypothetical protein
MTENEPRTSVGTGMKVALVAAGLAAGAIGATALNANATTSGTGSTASSTTAAGTETPPTGTRDPHQGGAPADRHGSAPVRDDESSVSASIAAKLKAAALRAVPGGSVYRVETDAGDATYEAHMTKADGTEVTVKFDKNLHVTGVEAGMGKGDPRPSR